MVAKTSLVAAYPPELGRDYGELAAEALALDEVAVGNNTLMASGSNDFGVALPTPGPDWLSVAVGDVAEMAPPACLTAGTVEG